MKKIALMASLDTKLDETLYAKGIIERNGCQAVVVDISTKNILEGKSDIGPVEILQCAGISWQEFDSLDKANRIDTMAEAIIKFMPELYFHHGFDGIVSIGGGQNARMAAAAMKELPFGVPKILASSLACGKRTMEQYVGTKDIMVMHTVADIFGLNDITRTVITNACNAMTGMVSNDAHSKQSTMGKTRLAATALGITSKCIEGVLNQLPDSKFEKTCFHANGVGGRCMEEAIENDRFDLVIDANLHEITCEMLGGYCTGSQGRLLKAIEKRVPLIVVPGALDMLDFFIDEEGKGLPSNISERKTVYHNSSIAHTKVFPEEAKVLAETVCSRLNRAESPVTLILPLKGFCEAAAPGGGMYYPQTDEMFISTFKKNLKKEIKIVEVDCNINDVVCQKAIIAEVMQLI
ncbi:Tm-1-like ATP-binding domain-containing protein [uncultured Sphaerochaeta sp.]|uniref:Tm-1-like ATP-binding domain-containing protein n=1 Tax=uncultured Sphaerochaeta sp. TaxID=886478 RepID=UPI002A0A28FB|nr:Tm-1-like ATP-binding domain-containing protein [uncultured Sphaerochaeta sp.]